MSKSPFAKKDSIKLKPSRNRGNVTRLAITIPYKTNSNNSNIDFDISHITHKNCDKNNEQIRKRIIYIRNFAKKANEYVKNGKSVLFVTHLYEVLRSYLFFCDIKNVDPFSKEGYLEYCGNDGELRHQLKKYKTSLRLWQRNDGEELGIKESSCVSKNTGTITALKWCGVYDESWKHLHRSFRNNHDPFLPYSDSEEKMIVSRLSELFFGLALQLIAIKKDEKLNSDKLPVTISLGSHQEELYISTSLQPSIGRVKANCAFNLTMGAAYHLLCYFTSFNDSIIRKISHPITIDIDNRDKSLKTVKIKGFKARANKEVSAILTNEVDDIFSFDVEKKTGVTFIKVLTELSSLYGSNTDLIYSLNLDGEKSNSFDISEINKHLVTSLNLVSSQRSLNLPWFRDLFYAFKNHESIVIKVIINEVGRSIVSRTNYPINIHDRTYNIMRISYLIFSCFTDNPLKGVLLPLKYSDRNEDGNVIVSFLYDNGDKGFFEVPASEVALIKNIEQWSADRADKSLKKYPRYLFRTGSLKKKPTLWEGFSPISANTIKNWSLKTNDYFISLQSSRFRETTSLHEYEDGNLLHLTNLLQNTLSTLERHYANGNPDTNKKILSQAIQVLERIATGVDLEQAKKEVKDTLSIPMLTHDEWLTTKTPTNPNGVMCNGKQNLEDGKKTQRATNKAVGKDLPCSEFDACFKCRSAKAVDEPNAIYKLISFIDVLKDALDRHPEAKQEVLVRIEAFECTLEAASPSVIEEAMSLFNKNGRHPRITMNHALVSIVRPRV
ncbi:hypothetical protein AB4238_06785 [Shewanella sp. 10N.286.45.A1]|uniref:hypothetical protein n=1 Tax=Shewanella sp. 10N.286.45.A1 TaxID=3229694 RepID=UPI00354F9D74